VRLKGEATQKLAAVAICPADESRCETPGRRAALSSALCAPACSLACCFKHIRRDARNAQQHVRNVCATCRTQGQTPLRLPSCSPAQSRLATRQRIRGARHFTSLTCWMRAHGCVCAVQVSVVKSACARTFAHVSAQAAVPRRTAAVVSRRCGAQHAAGTGCTRRLVRGVNVADITFWMLCRLCRLFACSC
jgi:hypothetical protein